MLGTAGLYNRLKARPPGEPISTGLPSVGAGLAIGGEHFVDKKTTRQWLDETWKEYYDLWDELNPCIRAHNAALNKTRDKKLLATWQAVLTALCRLQSCASRNQIHRDQKLSHRLRQKDHDTDNEIWNAYYGIRRSKETAHELAKRLHKSETAIRQRLTRMKANGRKAPTDKRVKRD
jgi:hypothetical protein